MENITDYDKPFLTYEEQMNLMESRNIIIQNRDFTRRALSGLSYYTIINGYKNTFLSQIGSDNFIEGTKFDDLYTLHMIDTNLNTIILKYILFVERYLKTILSQKITVFIPILRTYPIVIQKIIFFGVIIAEVHMDEIIFFLE